jgi:hypothetical protein
MLQVLRLFTNISISQSVLLHCTVQQFGVNDS